MGDWIEMLPRQGLRDRYGRDITYLRVSVTDRCDLRCVYCMSEHMTFLPRRDLLSLEERVLLRRLGVVGGGWTLESAESIGAGDGVAGYQVLDKRNQTGWPVVLFLLVATALAYMAKKNVWADQH